MKGGGVEGEGCFLGNISQRGRQNCSFVTNQRKHLQVVHNLEVLSKGEAIHETIIPCGILPTTNRHLIISQERREKTSPESFSTQVCITHAKFLNGTCPCKPNYREITSVIEHSHDQQRQTSLQPLHDTARWDGEPLGVQTRLSG